MSSRVELGAIAYLLASMVIARDASKGRDGSGLLGLHQLRQLDRVQCSAYDIDEVLAFYDGVLVMVMNVFVMSHDGSLLM